MLGLLFVPVDELSGVAVGLLGFVDFVGSATRGLNVGAFLLPAGAFGSAILGLNTSDSVGQGLISWGDQWTTVLAKCSVLGRTLTGTVLAVVLDCCLVRAVEGSFHFP